MYSLSTAVRQNILTNIKWGKHYENFLQNISNSNRLTWWSYPSGRRFNQLWFGFISKWRHRSWWKTPTRRVWQAPPHRRKTAAWGGWKTYSWFGLILHEDAFGYRFIGRTGLYLVLKKQTFGLLALSLTLSHGERELGCRAWTFSGLPAIWFPILRPLIFSNLIPSPRGRGLGRG